jgi:hypothetical protein
MTLSSTKLIEDLDNANGESLSCVCAARGSTDESVWDQISSS